MNDTSHDTNTNLHLMWNRNELKEPLNKPPKTLKLSLESWIFCFKCQKTSKNHTSVFFSPCYLQMLHLFESSYPPSPPHPPQKKTASLASESGGCPCCGGHLWSIRRPMETHLGQNEPGKPIDKNKQGRQGNRQTNRQTKPIDKPI